MVQTEVAKVAAASQRGGLAAARSTAAAHLYKGGIPSNSTIGNIPRAETL